MSTVTVATTTDALQATIWVDSLRAEGIRAASLETGMAGAFGGATMPLTSYRVIVREQDIGAARNVIAGMSGAAGLAPFGPETTAASRSPSRLMLLALALIIGGGLAGIALARALG